jgi:hypothetical protein
MADLNELDKIENQLKKLIEEREFHDKLWREGSFVKVDSEFDEQYNKNKSKFQIENAAKQLFQQSETFMAVREHGRPFDTTVSQSKMEVKEHISHSRMAVREHGRPFSGRTCRTDMKIEEHGRPFDEQPRRFAVTKMKVKEHGRPFDKNSKRTVTEDVYLMASPVHGKPFFSSMSSWLSFGTSKTAKDDSGEDPMNMAVEENGQPYEKK